MTVTIKAVMDFDLGLQIGARLYTQAAPTVQVGADVILDQSARVTHYASGALSDVTVSTLYDVDLFLASGGTITEASPLASTSLYVDVDGSTNWLGSDDHESDSAAIARIDTATQLISSTGSVTVYGSSTPGSTVILKQGDDYTGTLAFTIAVSDVGSVIHDAITDAGVSEITFGAGRAGKRDEITGTVTSSHAADVTTLTVAVTQAVTAAAQAGANYEYDVQYTLTSGLRRSTPVTGLLELLIDRNE